MAMKDNYSRSEMIKIRDRLLDIRDQLTDVLAGNDRPDMNASDCISSPSSDEWVNLRQAKIRISMAIRNIETEIHDTDEKFEVASKYLEFYKQWSKES